MQSISVIFLVNRDKRHSYDKFLKLSELGNESNTIPSAPGNEAYALAYLHLTALNHFHFAYDDFIKSGATLYRITINRVTGKNSTSKLVFE